MNPLTPVPRVQVPRVDLPFAPSSLTVALLLASRTTHLSKRPKSPSCSSRLSSSSCCVNCQVPLCLSSVRFTVTLNLNRKAGSSPLDSIISSTSWSPSMRPEIFSSTVFSLNDTDVHLSVYFVLVIKIGWLICSQLV